MTFLIATGCGSCSGKSSASRLRFVRDLACPVLKVFGFCSNLTSRSVIIRLGCQGRRLPVFTYKEHDLHEVCPGQRSGAVAPFIHDHTQGHIRP